MFPHLPQLGPGPCYVHPLFKDGMIPMMAIGRPELQITDKPAELLISSIALLKISELDCSQGSRPLISLSRIPSISGNYSRFPEAEQRLDSSRESNWAQINTFQFY
jgi:hypothetical protein